MPLLPLPHVRAYCASENCYSGVTEAEAWMLWARENSTSLAALAILVAAVVFVFLRITNKLKAERVQAGYELAKKEHEEAEIRRLTLEKLRRSDEGK